MYSYEDRIRALKLYIKPRKRLGVDHDRPFLVAGRMEPPHQNGRQYRYYVSKSEMRFGAAARTGERIPADGVEAVTVAQIRTVLSSPESIAAGS